MKKTIIVACGGAVATSTVAASKIIRLCKANGIEANIRQMRISEINSNTYGADLIVTTSRIKRDYGVPYVFGMPFVSGFKEEDAAKQVLDILLKDQK